MFRRMLLVSSIAIASMSGIAMAQPAPGEGGGPGQGGPGGGRGGRGDFNPEEMRQRMMDMMKQQMGASDEEWAVLQPKIEAVTNAQRDARVGGFGGGWGGRGGFGGGGPGGGGGGEGRRGDREGRGEQSPVATAARSLNETLQNESASADEIQQKLTAYREARTQAEEKLKAAREDLKGVLNERQEAFLVLRSILE